MRQVEDHWPLAFLQEVFHGVGYRHIWDDFGYVLLILVALDRLG